MFETIDISSIMISFNSAKDNLICVRLWSDIAGTLFPHSLGIARAVFTVVPLIFMAATVHQLEPLAIQKAIQDSMEHV